jgi:hypothetical protein
MVAVDGSSGPPLDVILDSSWLVLSSAPAAV